MSTMNNESRIEKHIVKSSNQYFSILMNFCTFSKNLYNYANYIVREEFINNGNWIRYAELDKILKDDKDHPDYALMPTAQTAQQTLRLLDKNWKSFFKSIKDWSKNKSKYLGKPKMPKYLKRDGFYQLILTNQNCKLKNDIIVFPKAFNGFSIKPKFTSRKDFVSFQQVRLNPHKNRIVVEIVYTICIANQKENNERYIGIDIGVDNLATVCNNVNEPAIIINGKPLKSINQYYNKKISYYREVCKCMNDKDYSQKMDKLTEKRNQKIEDYMHKASKAINNYCEKFDISTIVIGKNSEWKQNSKLSKKVNQHFVQIPFARFIQMI